MFPRTMYAHAHMHAPNIINQLGRSILTYLIWAHYEDLEKSDIQMDK